MKNRATGFVYSPEYLKHVTGAWHPESPKRLQAIWEHLKECDVWSSLEFLEPMPADPELVGLVHPESYVRHIASVCSRGATLLDGGDTAVCSDSYQVALLAVGGVVEAVRGIVEGRIRNAFCAVRPPGHHAEVDAARGFCLFNNVAIATKCAQEEYDVDRVLILDWDVHHGNGTQHIFDSDPTVFYISLHQYPFYPGTGDRSETGTGPGLGSTRNFPLAAGSGDEQYLDIMTNSVVDLASQFAPQLIIISSGFDAHLRDPLAQMRVSTETFMKMTEIMVELAWELCDGRLLSVLEGGYDLTALRECTEVHLSSLVADAA